MAEALKYDDNPIKAIRNRKTVNVMWGRDILAPKALYVTRRKKLYNDVVVKPHKDHDVAHIEKQRILVRTAELIHRLSFKESSGFPKLVSVINAARAEFPSHDNWDDGESPGYADYTWRRVERFLIGNALNFWRQYRYFFPPPEITPGPKGSIDLFWRTNNRELLINVPADSDQSISYYGDDREEGTENAVRGKKLDESPDNDWIFLWLTK